MASRTVSWPMRPRPTTHTLLPGPTSAIRRPCSAIEATVANAAWSFVTPSGIGMAVNAKTFDPLVRDFLAYALTEYPKVYAATGALSPTTNVETTIPANATPLYERAVTQANEVGEKIAMPWDTQLDPTSNTRLQQELTLLVQGEVTPDEFASTMDGVIAENAPAKSK